MKKILIVLSFIILSCVGIFLYAMFVGTSGLIIKEYKVTNVLVNDNHGMKIVHFTDLHYGGSVFEEELANMVDKINEIDPDIIFFTGDLFKVETAYDKDILIKYLSLLDAKLGKYYILGNHDIQIDDALDIFNKSNFTNLSNTYKVIYYEEPFIVSGLSSNEVDNLSIEEKTKSYNEYISTNDLYSILILHEPDVVNDLNIDNYDLILGGHSHLGQVRLPFIGSMYTPVGSKDYSEEYYKINNTDLYISGGIGTSTLDIRLFNKPSINFYRLTKK